MSAGAFGLRLRCKDTAVPCPYKIHLPLFDALLLHALPCRPGLGVQWVGLVRIDIEIFNRFFDDRRFDLAFAQ